MSIKRKWKRAKSGPKAQQRRVVDPAQMSRAFRGIMSPAEMRALAGAAALRKGSSGRRKGDPRRQG